MWSQNCNLRKVREYVVRVANWHGVRVSSTQSNEEALAKFNEKYPDSQYTPKHWQILTTFQPDQVEIQNVSRNNNVVDYRENSYCKEKYSDY